MLRLTSLELERFRSFVEPAQIAFPASGLVQVRGNGSGCGKSSIFLGIAEALCVCPVPASQLKSWFSDLPRRVSASFKDDDGPAFSSIRESGMQLIVDGLVLDGAPKFLQEKLRDLIGVKSLDWIVPLTYRPQGAGSFFLGLTDGEKKEFLSSILGLDVYEAALEQAELAAKAEAENLAVVQKDFAVAEGRLVALRAAVANAPAPEASSAELQARLAVALAEDGLARASLAEAELKIARHGTMVLTPDEAGQIALLDQEIEKAIDPLVTQFERRLAGVEAQMAQNLQNWAAAQRAYQDQRVVYTQKKAEVSKHEMALAVNEQKLAAVASKMEKALHSICPTCAQDLPDDRVIRQLRDEKAGLTEAEERISGLLKKAQDLAIEPVAPDRPDTGPEEKIKATLRLRLDIQRAKETQVRSGLASQLAMVRYWAQQRHDNALADVRELKDTLSAKLQGLAGEISQLRAEIRMAEADAARAAVAAAALVTGEGAFAQASEALEKAKASVAAEEDFIALIGYKGFLGSIFDEVLLDISQETNRLLNLLPNVSHVSMYLASAKTTASSKKTKKAISPVFRSHGYEVGDAWQKVFSGGQVTAIQLAIDLAVAKVVGRRTGVTPGWLILDEPFIGLPADEVEQIMSVLHVLSQDRLVLVVHHDSQSQEMFGQTIEVKCENGRSTVKTS